jgi:acetyl esterase/lipase
VLDTPTPHAAIVVCPGGGYTIRAEHEGEPVARWLNSIGLPAFVCHYRVQPFRHPCAFDDARRALRWVRHHAPQWRIDPNRVGMLGFSAGGHLVSTVGTHWDYGDPRADDPLERISCRPDAMVLCYPVITLGEHGHQGCATNLLGDEPDETLRGELSNETQVTPETPPTFLWHTADDAGVSVKHSLLFAEALDRCGVLFELHVFQSGAHGLGLAPDDPAVSAWTSLCEEWLRGLGFLPRR